jgi:DNA-binding XRE family transcriptional regulator
MANIATVLKDEITRLARKEIRSEIEGIKKISTQHRSEIAALKRRIATLEQQVLRFDKSATKNAEVKASPEVGSKVRFIAKGFITLRKRLGLTAETIGHLLGVSAQTIYSWESEKSRPREQQLVRIAVLRGMGKRDVDTILKQLAG